MNNMSNMNNMGNMNCGNRSRLMHKIQQHSFALVETTLFLDGHPNCQKALRYFDCQKALYDKYVAEYEQNFGPLSPHSGAGSDTWQWIQGPWPWESEAN